MCICAAQEYHSKNEWQYNINGYKINILFKIRPKLNIFFTNGQTLQLISIWNCCSAGCTIATGRCIAYTNHKDIKLYNKPLSTNRSIYAPAMLL